MKLNQMKKIGLRIWHDLNLKIQKEVISLMLEFQAMVLNNATNTDVKLSLFILSPDLLS